MLRITQTGVIPPEWSELISSWYVWSDGNEVINIRGSDLSIERVHGEKSRRKRWCVVNRNASEAPKWAKSMLYPPKLAGPFETVEDALVFVKIITAAGQYLQER